MIRRDGNKKLKPEQKYLFLLSNVQFGLHSRQMMNEFTCKVGNT